MGDAADSLVGPHSCVEDPLVRCATLYALSLAALTSVWSAGLPARAHSAGTRLRPLPSRSRPAFGAPSPLSTALASRRSLFKAFVNDTVAYYTTFEVSDPGLVRPLHGTFPAPRLELANEAGVDEFFNVTNGVSGQVPVLGSPPGDPDYSPIWRLVEVTWKRGARRQLLTSEDDIEDQADNLTIEETDVFFNCPVLLVSDDLRAAGLRPAPTLALGPQLIDWEITRRGLTGTALYRVEAAWYEGRRFAFLGLEAAPEGLMPNGPLLVTVPKLSLNNIASTPPPAHDPVNNFYVVQFQAEPVLDAIPEPEDVESYSPIWHIHFVTFNAGHRPRPLHSVDEIEDAVAAGDVTVVAGSADAVFNCPVISATETTRLPRASTEVRFLARVGILTAGQARELLRDLSRGDEDEYIADVDALVDADVLTPEIGQLLLELGR